MRNRLILLAAGTWASLCLGDPAPPLCTYSLSPGGQGFSSQGGPGAFSITASDPTCPWSVGAMPPLVVLSSPGSGVGNGVVSYDVLPNFAGGAAVSKFDVAGQTFTVEQQDKLITNLTFVGTIAQIASAGTWKTTFNYINLDTSAATARFNFLNDSGGALSLPFTFPQSPPASGPLKATSLDRTLNAGESFVMESTGPNAQPTSTGYSHLLANGNINGFAIFNNTEQNWEAVVPLETRNARSYFLAFDNTGNLATGIAIANLDNFPANIVVVFRDSNGDPFATYILPVPTMGHTSFMLKDTFPATAGRRGTAEFQTPNLGWLSILGLRSNGPSLTTLPVFANFGAGGGTLPHILYNGGFANSFTFVNTTSTAAPVTLRFFRENGTPLAVPLALPETTETLTTAELTRTIPGFGSLLIETIGQESQPVVLGSAQLSSTGSIGGFGLFRWIGPGQEASVPLENRNAASYVLVFDNTNGLTTGLALAGVTNLASSVPAIIRDDTGAILQSPVIHLPARGHTSFMLPGAYPITAGKRGTIEFATPPGRRISVLGLRATPTGNLTTIPVFVK